MRDAWPVGGAAQYPGQVNRASRSYGYEIGLWPRRAQGGRSRHGGFCCILPPFWRIISASRLFAGEMFQGNDNENERF
jgi:hypothetical protein